VVRKLQKTVSRKGAKAQRKANSRNRSSQQLSVLPLREILCLTAIHLYLNPASYQLFCIASFDCDMLQSVRDSSAK
jgi:hypothetical protein